MKFQLLLSLAALTGSYSFSYSPFLLPSSHRSPDHSALKASRRDFLLTTSSSISISSLLAGTVAPNPAVASSKARVKVYPGLEYLEPIYELSLSVAALQRGVADPSKWPQINKRLKDFLAGGIMSERNYYGAVGLQYTFNIEYDPGELKEFVRLDQIERKDTLENALLSIEDLQKAIAMNDERTAAQCAQAAASCLQQWLNFVPAEDLQAVEKLFKDTRVADKDQNGTWSDDELATLPEDERQIWKRRLRLFGSL